MSRALRKARKVQLDALQSVGQDVHSSDEDAEPISSAPNPFDMLNAAQDVEDEAGSLAKESDSETEGVRQALAESSIGTTDTAPKKRKTKQRKKRSAKKAQPTARDNVTVHEEDFEAVLSAHQEVVANSIVPELKTTRFDMTELLAVNIKMLDPNAEMRRLFGAKVVAAERSQQTLVDRTRQSVRRRNPVLVPMEDSYPMTIKGGLEMRLIEDLDGIKVFKFVHSTAYRETQSQFVYAVELGDPQALLNILRASPFHIDTLLQASEIVRHQGENELSLDFLTRALFAFDRAFLPSFNIASGMVRLPFEYPENRPFYLAIYRYMQSLGRRGCWATAFEFNKLLYALAPEEDPYAALLSIDFYAIKARNWTYIDKLIRCPWDLVLDDNFYNPSFQYAQALASFLALPVDGDDATAKTQLSAAIAQFPYIAQGLFQELKATGPIEYDDLVPGTEFGRLMRDLYVFRAKDLYNTPEMTKFLRDSALSTTEFYTEQLPDKIPTNVSRHILLLDERSLLHYLSKEITASPGLSFDPLPPQDSLPYNYSADQAAQGTRD